MIEGAAFLTSALATRPYRVQSLPLRPHRWLSRTTIVIIGFVLHLEMTASNLHSINSIPLIHIPVRKHRLTQYHLWHAHLS